MYTLGRWKSQCYKLYISTPKSIIAGAHAAMAHPELCTKF